jgi:ribosomal protein S18 acetylase RimI-like enzyme
MKKKSVETELQFKWHFSNSDIDWEELSNLYKVAPLGNKKPDELHICFSNSMYKCFVYKSQILVGVGRALADGIDCSYICDVAVLPEYQGIGLGKNIIEKLIEMSTGHKKIILYSVPGAEPFYKKMGFKRMSTAMAIFENQEHASKIGLLLTD